MIALFQRLAVVCAAFAATFAPATACANSQEIIIIEAEELLALADRGDPEATYIAELLLEDLESGAIQLAQDKGEEKGFWGGLWKGAERLAKGTVNTGAKIVCIPTGAIVATAGGAVAGLGAALDKVGVPGAGHLGVAGLAVGASGVQLACYKGPFK